MVTAESRRLRNYCRRVVGAIKDFRTRHQHSVPPAALASINDFVSTSGALVENPEESDERLWIGLVLLTALESEVTHLLAEAQAQIRARSERAFLHLQRTIVVDLEFRTKWQRALASGEVDCEQLGSVHLLSHGIWAFKAGTAGARTDLVYQDKLVDLGPAERFVEGLVLTEWKIASSEKEAARKFSEARAQASLYAAGALAGIELAQYRFAVVVTRNEVTPPVDEVQGGIVYRHINIAVEPQLPSRSARRRAASPVA